ncbi:MAG: glycosyltransferase [Chloroflexales bacterium]|nr:glycosyltransferase [Chloroflexales bacterium]
MESPRTAELYDDYYYAHGCGRPYQRDEGWLHFFGAIAERIVQDIQPQTVLDAGCALGLLVETLRDRDVAAFGVDISTYAIEQVYAPVQPYCWAGSVADPFPQHYDLIVCIEVLEHMPQIEAEQAIINFCRHTNDILFSSTPFDYKEVTHFNVQPPEYWAEQFARQGFYRDIDFDATFIMPWTVRFRRRSDPVQRLIRDYERKFWLLNKENSDLRSLTLEMRDQLAVDDRSNRQLSLQLEERDQLIKHYTAELQSRSVIYDQIECELNTYIDQLERELAQKIEHISHLKAHITQLESGRVMRVLHTVARLRRRTVEAPAVPAYPQVHPVDSYQTWIAANEPDAHTLARQRQHGRQFAYRPLISIITPVYNPLPSVLRDTIESVRAQTYDHWELCLVDGGSALKQLQTVLANYAKQDERIRVTFLERNLGISGNSNVALEMAQGEYILFFDHDDLLAPNALYEIVCFLNEDPSPDIIYYDEDKIAADGVQRHSPWFKPSAWSPDLMLSVNYLMHSCIRRTLVERVGGFDPEMDGAQDWDLALRCAEQTQQMHHIPQVLYHWRQVAGSAAGDMNAKPWAFDAQVRCVAAHLRRIGVMAPRLTSPTPGNVRILWPTFGLKVSIIIPTKDKLDILQPCLTSILKQTMYANYEIILVDTGSVQPETQHYYAQLASDDRVKLVYHPGPFNYSAANNIGVRHATGDRLLFLNNDTEVLTHDWLDELVGWVERAEIGIVGCKLLRPDGTIQHAGIAMGVEGHGSHLFDGAPEHTYGPFGSSEWYRDYMAVTGACILMRREVFEKLGGFDEAYQVAYSDIELCLRAVEHGYRVVYTPFARLLHHEGATRGFDQPPSDVLRAYMRMLPLIQAGDPFFSLNLSAVQRQPTLAQPGEETINTRLNRILHDFGLINGSITVSDLPSCSAAQPDPDALKLLFVTSDLSMSGAPLMLYRLARELQTKGYVVTIASPTDGPLHELCSAAQIAVLVDQYLFYDARIAYQSFAHYTAVLANTINSYRIVHAARAAQIPCVWWIHESHFGQQMAQHDLSVARAFEAADLIVLPARMTASAYSTVLHNTCVKIIPYGLAKPQPAAPDKLASHKPDQLVVVCIGSVEPRKGQDTLMRGIASLPKALAERLEVYVIGGVIDWVFYQEVAKFANQMPNVHMIGSMAPEQAMAYLASADICVLPSRDEVLPIVLLEAISYGKSVIATNVGGVAEAITHGQEGLLIQAEDYQDLARCLTRLIDDSPLRRQLGEQARRRFLRDFTQERFVADMEQVIAHILEQHTHGK